MAPPSTRYARSGDVHLAYQVIGDGARDLVLALDWASHLEVLWEQPFVQELVSSLERFARVLWFDMRGIGLSDRALDAPAAPEDWLDDVAAVMDAAGSERAALVAHGHAAQMALLATATHADRIESLVLLNGFARFALADDYPAGMPEAAAQAAVEQVAETWGRGTMAALLGPSVAERPGMTEWYGRLERFSASPGTAIARMRAILELDVREILPLVSTPTLVIQNAGDMYVRAGHGRYLAEHIPGARLLERDSPDHWPVPEHGPAGRDGGIHHRLARRPAGGRPHPHDGPLRRRRRLDRARERARRPPLAADPRPVRRHRRAGGGRVPRNVRRAGARAIRCAWGIRDAVQRAGLEVRSGLHTGEVTQVNGDVAGIAVHIGARVSELAQLGEVLVTRTVRDLVAGSEIRFDDRGEFPLKGVSEHWELYATSN